MDKPFLTFEQQIEKLKNEYKLTILNDEFATEALSSISYYDLINGYKSMYMTDHNEYMENVSIELLFETHIYNKNIQGVLMKYSTYVENSFKTILSHIIADNFSEEHQKYLDIQNYKRHHSSEQRKNLRLLINTLNNRCINCEDNPTLHYIKTKDHIPPWILFRNITFSDTTELFSNMKSVQKEMIIEQYQLLNKSDLRKQEQISVLLSSLRLVRKFRNKIAHNLDFICYRKSSIDKSAFKIFNGTLIESTELNRENRDIWCLVLAIVILLNNKYLVQNFLAELSSYLLTNPRISNTYCHFTGIPTDFKTRIETYFISNKLLA